MSSEAPRLGRKSLWESGRDEQVEVNQRALIDKVLARYSGEFTVFRELLQNADDAQARRAEIRFDTKAYMDDPNSGVQSSRLPNLKRELLHQWSFRNDGMPFREEDWNRLKKIAEGNPDEEKIGAFGVGFYSLFSVTDEPFVKSGPSWMGFYWRDGKDQLYARRGNLPPAETMTEPGVNPWTSFEMVLREPGPLPAPPVELARFLATSLTFMARLREISVYFNDKRLIHITKDVDDPRSLPIPRNLNNNSPTGMMKVTGIEHTAIRMKAEILRWVYTTGVSKPHIAIPAPIQTVATGFFSGLFSRKNAASPSPVASPTPPVSEPDPFTVIDSNVALSVYTAQVDVKMDRKLLSELERATKKKPPSHSAYSLIYTSKDDYDASKKEDEREFQSTGSVFQGLRADLDGNGSARVFIGQATAQTTGVAGHMAARFIPTVERESIDLVDRHVSQWNKELLFIGGFLCRAVWELKMSDIGTLWQKSTDTAFRQDLIQKCLHVLKFFSVYRASPSAMFSDYIEAAFFACSRDRSINILSTAGVLNALRVRLPKPEFSGFLKKLPMVPEEFVAGAPHIISMLREKNFVREITFSDVLDELKARPLSEQEMTECLKWRINLNTDGIASHADSLKRQFLDAAVLTYAPADETTERVIPLSTITAYLNPKGAACIPTDVPLPPYTLPYSVSRSLPLDKLPALFEWTELKLVPWLNFITSTEDNIDTNICLSPAFAERVLVTIVARAWGSQNEESKKGVVQILQPKSCIPTNKGMRVAAEAYFPTAHIFEDLPIIQFSKAAAITRSPLERVLIAIGVRKHVDLQLVFNRMVTSLGWSISDLVQYLVDVKDTLAPEEWTRLRHTAAFPKEGGGPLSSDNKWMAQDLYEPNDSLRQLGLPIIAWETKWKPHSDEAKLLFGLGLKRYPPVEAILELAAGNPPTSQLALEYYLNNFDDKYAKVDAAVFKQHAFVPAVQADGQKVRARPSEVFLSGDSAVFGFSVLDPAYQNVATKFRISEHPPMSDVVSKLVSSPPSTIRQATPMFEYMSNRLGSVVAADLARLSHAAIIPYKEKQGSDSKPLMLKPSECYFAGGSQANGTMNIDLFHFVDFGTRANAFLRQCGVKSEPTVQEIAKMLASNPQRFYEASGASRYLAVLRNMAANRHLLSNSLTNNLKRSAFLLCTRREVTRTPTKAAKRSDDDADGLYVSQLRKAGEIVIVDDAAAYASFNSSLFGAPQEDTLEAFYEQLGSPRLSRLVTIEYKPHGIIQNSQVADDTRTLILERLPLFLHDAAFAGRLKLVVEPSWLADEDNFKVLAVRSLSLTQQLNFNSIRLTHTTEISAGGQRTGTRRTSPSCLWVSLSDALDMYEVAHTLCSLIFEHHTVNDSLLLSTLLSTDLRALRRRGFAVDRILQQRKEHEEARIAQERETRLQAEAMSLSRPESRNGLETDQPGSFMDTLNKFRNRLQRKDEQKTPSLPLTTGPNGVSGANETQTSPQPPPYPGTYDEPIELSEDTRGMPGSLPPPMPTRPRPARSPRPDPHVTPLSNIEANLNMALAGCRPEQKDLLRNRQEMIEVKESLDEGYCDATGAVGDLVFVGNVDEHRFYTKGVRDPQELLANKRQALQRFSSLIVAPIAWLYGVPQTSLHIFFDTEGPLIAFNRNGSIFLNLRYYEAWHDKEVQQSDLSKALISWFFTLAHEIAHNLVLPHNSEHEFYFSSLCESKLPGLAQLITRS